MTEHERALEEASETLQNHGIENHAILTFDDDASDFVVAFDEMSEWSAQHAIGMLNLCEDSIVREVLQDE